MTIKPPKAKRIKNKISRKYTTIDPYDWLRDPDWKNVIQNPASLQNDIRQYLEAENSYTQTNLEIPTQNLRKTLFAEMKARTPQNDADAPTLHGPYAYYQKYQPGCEYPTFVRKDRKNAWNPEAPEMSLLDGNSLAEQQAYFKFGHVSHSPNHRLLAWSADTKGSEFYTLYIRDLHSGNSPITPIHNTCSNFLWSPDSTSIYWIRCNSHGRAETVFRRHLDSNEDTPVYKENDPGFFLTLSQTQSRRFTLIRSGDHTCSEHRVIDHSQSCPHTTHLLAPRQHGIEYEPDDHDGKFFILTNYNAEDFRIVSAPYNSQTTQDWREQIPHQNGTLILDMIAFSEYLIRLEQQNALPHLIIRCKNTRKEHRLDFNNEACHLQISKGLEYNTTRIRLIHSSPAQPATTFDYDMKTRQRYTRKLQNIPCGHNHENYQVKRLLAPAHDGKTIPITMLKHKNTPVNGSAPLLLYGYGAYGYSINADFQIPRLSLVDRGFVYAIAHVRGGKEKGHAWYLDGKLEHKPNTFHDYISAAQYLIQQGYSSSGNIVGMGASAGGLLMGAAANIAPEIFAGIIAAVPFVDVLNTMSDSELPLTPPEWPEWGNPSLDENARRNIASYSPYDQTSSKPYPPMLITGGLTDPRVTYWEPAKWIAKLRHLSPNAGPYFLRMNMEAGHGGASGRFHHLHEKAIEYAFALSVTGMDNSPDRPSRLT